MAWRVAAAWPKVARRTAGIRHWGPRLASLRRRLFGTRSSAELTDLAESADDGAAARRDPFGVALVAERRSIVRAGYRDEIRLSPLQYAVAEKLLAATAVDMPCAADDLNAVWERAGVTAKPTAWTVAHALGKLTQILTALEMEVRSARYLGHFLAPRRADRFGDFRGGDFRGSEFEAAATADVPAWFGRAVAERAGKVASGEGPPGRELCNLGYLGLAVDEATGELHRDGFAAIRLSPLRLEIVRRLASARGGALGGADVAAAWSAAPGTRRPHAEKIKAALRQTNRQLSAIGIVIHGERSGRRLVEREASSPTAPVPPIDAAMRAVLRERPEAAAWTSGQWAAVLRRPVRVVQQAAEFKRLKAEAESRRRAGIDARMRQFAAENPAARRLPAEDWANALGVRTADIYTAEAWAEIRGDHAVDVRMREILDARPESACWSITRWVAELRASSVTVTQSPTWRRLRDGPRGVDRLMRQILDANPEAAGWPRHKWAEVTGKHFGTIKRSATWQALRAAREGRVGRRGG